MARYLCPRPPTVDTEGADCRSSLTCIVVGQSDRSSTNVKIGMTPAARRMRGVFSCNFTSKSPLVTRADTCWDQGEVCFLNRPLPVGARTVDRPDRVRNLVGGAEIGYSL